MAYLDNEGSTFVRLTAEHRLEQTIGQSSIAHVSKARRIVEVRQGRIVRKVSPLEALFRRFFDDGLKHQNCGTFFKPVSDQGPFPLDAKLAGIRIMDLRRTGYASSSRQALALVHSI